MPWKLIFRNCLTISWLPMKNTAWLVLEMKCWKWIIEYHSIKIERYYEQNMILYEIFQETKRKVIDDEYDK